MNEGTVSEGASSVNSQLSIPAYAHALAFTCDIYRFLLFQNGASNPDFVHSDMNLPLYPVRTQLGSIEYFRGDALTVSEG